MIHTFEEIVAHQSKPEPIETEQSRLLQAIAGLGVLAYLWVTVVLPYFVVNETVTGSVPLFFSVVFVISTLVFLLAWSGWVLVHQKMTHHVSWWDGWPLLAILVAPGLFYLLGLVARLFRP